MALRMRLCIIVFLVVGSVILLIVLKRLGPQENLDQPTGRDALFSSDPVEERNLQELAAGSPWIEPQTGLTFRFVPPGTFTQGDPRKTDVYGLLRVTITRGFWMTETPVSERHWRDLLVGAPSESIPLSVSQEPPNWWETLKIANELSLRAGFEACYELTNCDSQSGRVEECEDVSFSGVQCTGYRLPTESEWEWAARADTDYFFAGSDDLSEVGFIKAEEGFVPAADSGGVQPNTWGFYLMSGGVFEWTWNSYLGQSCPMGFWEATDPTGPIGTHTDRRILRGCSSVYSRPEECTVFARDDEEAGMRHPHRMIGFRLVRTVSH